MCHGKTKREGIAAAMDVLKTRFFEKYGVDCPVCGQPLLRPKTLNIQTGRKMAGACPNCGYMEAVQHSTIPDQAALTTSARKNDALGYLTNYSVFSNLHAFNHRFDNYTTENSSDKQALEHCETVARKIMNLETIHSLLMGATGLGKTHLAIGMMYYILEQTGYKYQITVMKDGHPEIVDVTWKILFIDWRALLLEKKESFNDEVLAKKLAKTMAELKRADIVILDDFGSERKTDYALDLADDFWRYREDKTVIITTNLIGDELTARYGNRLLSRMKNHGVGYSFAFKGRDHRGMEAG
ncbi:DNA replication protein [Lactobacillus plantarum] [Lactiplantibacillus mudanjiangensis]|uniref:DNA replication protein [Lactobacillus plantarum] n=2 Tax=Lactiplantibacillus mudanjiangensis TaxID=1296538 RepID=A0A660E812_9LACO|nr:DNA replication protein [Lactobacillus plantarum] [Lactiplantibacillus mudanjiangensis]VDG30183.1 DNA replication protein [Lactobacillus plantarum] [Lactiplantibacillus mudanjiangensis]